MANKVISVEHLTKKYDLGVIGTGTLTRDLERWWARVRNKPDPYSIIGQENRNKRIGESILALDDVSFSVEQGEALGIIGKNGAGKSTLLKILSRVTAPTSGVVKVKGRIGSLLEVGTGFHPELTGRENIYLNGAILGMRKDEVTRKFDEIVDFSGVEKFIDTPVKRYSSGMYVRLAFAVAAHLDPEILVVDEVLAVGDAEFQKKCLGKMGDVTGEGRTVLFVSHNMTAIQKLCTECILLKNGRLELYGESEKVVNAYLDIASENDYQGEMDLSKWQDRYGRGGARILRGRLIDTNNQLTVNFQRTKPMSFEFDFEATIPHMIELSAIILSDSGDKIIHLSNHDTVGMNPGILQGKYAVRFSIPNLPLNEGTYRLLLGIHSGNTIPLDVVTNVLPFEVKDIKDTHRPFKTVANVGYCLIPNHCSIRNLA